ncbi:hypothetical protein, partial [Segatella copri]|uniref:hypothetical protein n=1 Tax=Segatella copri TaxID=165179 RepID=UPI0022E5003E
RLINLPLIVYWMIVADFRIVLMGDYKSPQGWSNLFRRRIANPPERLTDFKFTGTPNGFQIHRNA